MPADSFRRAPKRVPFVLFPAEKQAFLVPCGCLAVALVALCLPSEVSSLGLCWSAGAGVSQPTEAREFLAATPSVGGSLLMRLTEDSDLGIMGDYAAYRTKRPDTDGFQWRALALVEWRFSQTALPPWCEPFGQFGIGAGRLEYVGYAQHEKLLGPAARLAAGLAVHLSAQLSVSTVLSFDRLDAAPNGMDRDYPTTLGLSVALAYRWPAGGALLAETATPRRGF